MHISGQNCGCKVCTGGDVAHAVIGNEGFAAGRQTGNHAAAGCECNCIKTTPVSIGTGSAVAAGACNDDAGFLLGQGFVIHTQFLCVFRTQMADDHVSTQAQIHHSLNAFRCMGIQANTLLVAVDELIHARVAVDDGTSHTGAANHIAVTIFRVHGLFQSRLNLNDFCTPFAQHTAGNGTHHETCQLNNAHSFQELNHTNVLLVNFLREVPQ